MSFLATHLVGFGAAAANTSAPASITFAAAAVNTSNVTDSTYTFASHSIGTASSDRYVIVAVACRGTFSAGNANISTVTVAGTNCTRAVKCDNSNGTAEIWITDSAITSGTTASVVVTTGGGVNVSNCGIGTFAVTGLLSNVATATATQTSDNTATNLSVSADGVAVAVGRSNDTNGAGASTWTNLTERYDALVENIGSEHSGACDNQASTQTLSITYDNAEGTPNPNVAFAAFR